MCKPWLIALVIAVASCASTPQGQSPAASTNERTQDDQDYTQTIEMFRTSASGRFFDNSYGYAVFPTVGKAGIVAGGAFGNGRVYVNGSHVGDSKLRGISFGLQLGAQVFSQIVFFQDQRAFKEFIHEGFEFGANAEAVAITAGVSAKATTAGNTATASGGANNAKNAGSYHKGLAVFTISKGGAMFEVSIAGQTFDYEPLDQPN